MTTPDFGKFDARARAGENFNVVFFGGSLTWGAQATDPQLTSYRARMACHLEERYPKAHFHYYDAAVGGTGSQLGAFRLQRDVLARKPDLVFLDFTVNDGAYDQPDPIKLASYESLVRRMVLAGISVEVVIFPLKRDLLPNQPPRPLDAKHKEIAKAYHLPVADVVAFLQKRVAEKTVNPEKLWIVAEDPTHPGDAAYALYAESAFATFKQAVDEGVVEVVPTAMLHDDTYLTINRASIAGLGSLPGGWTVGLPNRIAITYDFLPSRWLDTIVIATAAKNPAPLRLTVQGRDVFLFGEATPHSGKYEVRVDGGTPKLYDAGTLAKNGNLRYIEMFEQGLDSGREHLFEITPQLDSGEELRLESICVAGSPATVMLKTNP